LQVSVYVISVLVAVIITYYRLEEKEKGRRGRFVIRMMKYTYIIFIPQESVAP
jgi:hypothetical protein